MAYSKKPTRRLPKRGSSAASHSSASSQKRVETRSQDATDETHLSLLRIQLDRAEAELLRVRDALDVEKDARALDAANMGEMLGRESRAVERARIAEETLEGMRERTYAEQKRCVELESKLAAAQIDRLSARSELEAKVEELQALEARWNAAERLHEEKVAALTAELEEERPRDTNGVDESADVKTLRAELDAARAESKALRESLAALRGRAATIGAGLKEMRELMVQSAALFDDLEQREHAIAEIRGRSMRDARALFLRAAGNAAAVQAPPLPGRKAPVEDLSDAVELLEEEVRASMRPPAMSDPEPSTLRTAMRPSAWPTDKAR